MDAPAALVASAPSVTWATVTWLLSVSGAAGGLAFHLVENKGQVIWPHRPKGAGHSLQLGGIADILVGVVASNGIHLGISGLVSYELAATQQAKFYTTFIALGVLSGFGGATLLRALSAKLRQTLLSDRVDELEGRVGQGEKQLGLLSDSRLQRMVEDRLLYRREMNDADKELLKMRDEEVRTTPEAERGSVDLLISAFRAAEDEHWQETISLAEEALKRAPPSAWLWAAHNLAGLAYHYFENADPRWPAKAKTHYLAALESLRSSPEASTIIRRQGAVTKTNLAFLHLDAGELDSCVSLCTEVLTHETTHLEAVPLILDFARIAVATAYARQNRPDDVIRFLEEVSDVPTVAHLFSDGSVNTVGIEALRKIEKLPKPFHRLVGLR
jgi:hypothetical protein